MLQSKAVKICHVQILRQVGKSLPLSDHVYQAQFRGLTAHVEFAVIIMFIPQATISQAHIYLVSTVSQGIAFIYRNCASQQPITTGNPQAKFIHRYLISARVFDLSGYLIFGVICIFGKDKEIIRQKQPDIHAALVVFDHDLHGISGQPCQCQNNQTKQKLAIH